MSNGILLTGGNGSRLFPLTGSINKHLIPITNKLVIDYPLKTLKDMGVTNLTVVLGGSHFEQVVKYLKGGKDFGFNINYVYQETPNGIAAAINLCERYVEDDETFTVCLGDNWFSKPIQFNKNHIYDPHSAKIALYKHHDPYRFGVASIDKNNNVVNLVEKPKDLDAKFDNYAITGCYRFNHNYFSYFKNLIPSLRSEFEIIDVIKQYLKDDALKFTIIDGHWSDMGLFESIEEVREILKNEKNISNSLGINS